MDRCMWHECSLISSEACGAPPNGPGYPRRIPVHPTLFFTYHSCHSSHRSLFFAYYSYHSLKKKENV